MQEIVKQTSKAETRESIREYLKEELVSFTEGVGEEELLEQYDLDSEQIVGLVVFLEGRFQIVIGDEDITIENLGTLKALVGFVERKREERKE